jgi:hypothetical protein
LMLVLIIYIKVLVLVEGIMQLILYFIVLTLRLMIL